MTAAYLNCSEGIPASVGALSIDQLPLFVHAAGRDFNSAEFIQMTDAAGRCWAWPLDAKLRTEFVLRRI